MGFLHGASQGNPGLCGAGAVIHLNEAHHTFHVEVGLTAHYRLDGRKPHLSKSEISRSYGSGSRMER